MLKYVINTKYLTRSNLIRYIMILIGMLAFVLPMSVSFWLVNLFTSWMSSDIEPSSPYRWFMGIVIPGLAMIWGYRKKSLDVSGVIAGSLIGFLLTVSNYSFIVCLLTFFVSSSKATKFKSKQKALFEDQFKEGGQRNWIQVICNAGIAAQMATLFMIEKGLKEITIDFENDYTASWLALAVLSAIAGANGDTWSSEFGSVLGRKDPILVTTLKRVPKGTNGGVSLVGVLASLAGGTLVGLAYYMSLLFCVNGDALMKSIPQWPIILVGSLAGLYDSLVDSILGATLQFSGMNSKSGKVVERPGPHVSHISGITLLDNHSVNLLSSLITAVTIPFLAAHIWTGFTIN